MALHFNKQFKSVNFHFSYLRNMNCTLFFARGNKGICAVISCQQIPLINRLTMHLCSGSNLDIVHLALLHLASLIWWQLMRHINWGEQQKIENPEPFYNDLLQIQSGKTVILNWSLLNCRLQVSSRKILTFSSLV